MAFHFPNTFFLLIPFAMIVGLYAWSRWRRLRDLSKLGDWRLIKQLVPIAALHRRRTKDTLGLIGAFLLIFSAAGPEFGSKLKEVKQRGVDVFIAMDTSRSMLAEDVPPSRLDRAKRALSVLIEKLGGNRVGIIAFAKLAVIQCPLTVDNDAARMFLDILDDKTVPEQGTSIGDAIRLALKSFPKDDKSGRAIVLLTDGEDHKSDPIGAAKEAKEAGVVIFTIGIGTSKGEVIKDRDDQGKVVAFHKHDGEMVLTRMDDGLLNEIAMITGGRYYRASSTDSEIDEIADALNGFDKKEFASKIYERLQERYQIFLMIALLLLLIEFFFGEKPGQLQRIGAWLTEMPKKIQGLRRKTAVAALLLVLLPSVLRADYKDHVRKGNQLLKKGDLAGARAEFESARIDVPEAPFLPYNIAATYYLEGNFDDAKKQYEQALAMTNDPGLRSKIQYNMGHMFFAMGQNDQAIDKFKQCLKLNPKDMDAKYNIEYIKAGKKPKTPPPQQKKNNSGDNKDQKDKSEKGTQEQKKPGELSKEDADRILQMMKDQESEKMKNAQLAKPGLEKPKDKKDEDGEDW
jgi:Ca-activated chloride channel family protein